MGDIVVLFRNGSKMVIGASLREVDKLRGKRYPKPEAYMVDPLDLDLLRYLHDEVLAPASQDPVD